MEWFISSLVEEYTVPSIGSIDNPILDYLCLSELDENIEQDNEKITTLKGVTKDKLKQYVENPTKEFTSLNSYVNDIIISLILAPKH